MNRVIHFEIHAADTAKMAEFYKKVFGWEIRNWGNADVDYWIVMTAPDKSKEPGINGGIVGRKGSEPKGGEPVSSFVCTIGVPSVDHYIKKIEAAGGKNVAPKMPIPGLAWLAYCTDIEGNIFGIYQDDKNAK
ncbi:hypothetical protein A2W14_05800 [Candidatus Gottesmanbacteria bacterium RBG_16_37_8]|uniref:VOC domain-containing protein n=1 Tax=Candidatus Gottesmanbacteria bacterium RBG_16_37_8 TaxID=1798371 RepID=A0A1F5YUR5_9BACT|nr:MAG: hypothetical protein A2W14_05800 [Candidatus Gottesmanbacteria bacterium RBG_16_37_8]